MLLYTNIDQKLRNKLHGLMRYKIGVTCVYNVHEIYTMLSKKGDNLMRLHLFRNSTDHVKNSEDFLVNTPMQYIILKNNSKN